MSQTLESFKKDINEFLNHFEQFEKIAQDRDFDDDHIFYLFTIFMDHHKYIEIK